MKKGNTKRSALMSLLAGSLLMAGTYFGGAAGCGTTAATATPTPTPTPAPTTTGSSSATSGGMATLNTGTAVIGFVPNGTSIGIVTIEGTAPGALTLQGEVKEAATSVTASFAVDTCSVNPSANLLFCGGFLSSMLFIGDLTGFVASGAAITGTEVDLSALATPPTSGSFSGGSCIICGVLSDSANNRVILSAGNGYYVVDNAGALVNLFPSDPATTPPTTLATENFSFSSGTIISGKSVIVSPAYDAGNNFIWLVDIDSGKVYHSVKTMVDATIDAANGITGLSAMGTSTISEPDSSAVDSTGVLAIADESAHGILLVDFSAGAPTVAFTDGTPGTFTGETYTVVPLDVGSRLTGITVGGDHLLFLEEEFSTGIGVFQLPTSAPAGGAIAITTYNWSTVPAPPWTGTSGDPHGIGVFVSNTSGHPEGVLINGAKDNVANVDLTSFLAAAPTVVGGHTVGDASGFVTFTAVTP